MRIRTLHHPSFQLSTSICRVAVLFVVAALAATTAPTLAIDDSSGEVDLVGDWQGALAVGPQQLRLVFKVRESSEGGVEATLDSPDQAATDIPIAKVGLSGATVRFEIVVLGAVFEGQLDDDGSTLDGEWRQSGRIFPLSVKVVKGSVQP